MPTYTLSTYAIYAWNHNISSVHWTIVRSNLLKSIRCGWKICEFHIHTHTLTHMSNGKLVYSSIEEKNLCLVVHWNTRVRTFTHTHNRHTPIEKQTIASWKTDQFSFGSKEYFHFEFQAHQPDFWGQKIQCVNLFQLRLEFVRESKHCIEFALLCAHHKPTAGTLTKIRRGWNHCSIDNNGLEIIIVQEHGHHDWLIRIQQSVHSHMQILRSASHIPRPNRPQSD